MQATDVLNILSLFQRAGIAIWLDGGWGVDALLGEQTRPHQDLDAVVQLADKPQIESTLNKAGFRITLEQLPTRFVMEDASQRAIDFHTIIFETRDVAVQLQPDGTRFYFSSDALEGTGMINGEPVACISVGAPLASHVGYPPQAKDIQDIRLLVKRFGVEPPSVYQPLL